MKRMKLGKKQLCKNTSNKYINAFDLALETLYLFKN